LESMVEDRPSDYTITLWEALKQSVLDIEAQGIKNLLKQRLNSNIPGNRNVVILAYNNRDKKYTDNSKLSFIHHPVFYFLIICVIGFYAIIQLAINRSGSNHNR
jgi:membrane-bound ClpP family serine protease